MSMREEFEAAVIAGSKEHGMLCDLTKDSTGDYRSACERSAWWAWNESRRALAIELPVATVSMFATSRDARAAQEGLDMARGAIADAGLKVKP